MAARNAVVGVACRQLIDRAVSSRRDLAVCKALLVEILNSAERGAPDFGQDALARIRAREVINGPLIACTEEFEGLMMLNSTDEERAAVESAVAGMESFLARLATDATAEPPAIP
jgi:hypothetical protein